MSCQDSIWSYVGLVQSCSQLQAQESASLIQASGNTLTPDQANSIAAGDVGATTSTFGAGQNPSACSNFSNLASFSTFGGDWFTCLGGVLESYAIWIGVGLVVLILLYGYVSSRR